MKATLELSADEMTAFWNIVEAATELWEQGKKNESNAKMLEAFDAIPEPKDEYDESFVVSDSLAQTNILLQDLTEAAKWVSFNQTCSPNRQDTGEREMLMGALLFEQGDLIAAKEAFTIGDQKSKKRLWKNQFYRNYFAFFSAK